MDGGLYKYVLIAELLILNISKMRLKETIDELKKFTVKKLPMIKIHLEDKYFHIIRKNGWDQNYIKVVKLQWKMKIFNLNVLRSIRIVQGSIISLNMKNIQQQALQNWLQILKLVEVNEENLKQSKKLLAAREQTLERT